MKCKSIFTIVLLFLFSINGFSQFFIDFKNAFHFYATNQQESFEHTIINLPKCSECSLNFIPNHYDENGDRVTNNIEYISGDGISMKSVFYITFYKHHLWGRVYIESFSSFGIWTFDISQLNDFTDNLRKKAELDYVGETLSGGVRERNFAGKNGLITEYFEINSGKGTIFIRLLEEVFNNQANQVISKENSHIIPITEKNGVYYIPVTIGGERLSYIIDTGASDISLPEKMEQYLVSTGAIREEDYREDKYYSIADGSTIKRRTVNLNVVKIGNIKIKNVTASIVGDDEPLLLGNSLLNKLKNWRIDKENKSFVIEL